MTDGKTFEGMEKGDEKDGGGNNITELSIKVFRMSSHEAEDIDG